MKISRKSDYALRALMTLVGRYGEGPISIRTLAKQNDIPQRFLEHIMLEMKSKNWVQSIAGRDGGFKLAKPPAEITLGDVVRHFDGILSPIGCVSVTNYEPCSQENVCRFRRIFLDIRNYVAKLMDGADLASVYRFTPVKRAEIFGDGAGI